MLYHLCVLHFLLFCPVLKFDIPSLRYVWLWRNCVYYARIPVSNYVDSKITLNFLLMVAGLLFCFSDLMLVFSRFIGLWRRSFPVCVVHIIQRCVWWDFQRISKQQERGLHNFTN